MVRVEAGESAMSQLLPFTAAVVSVGFLLTASGDAGFEARWSAVRAELYVRPEPGVQTVNRSAKGDPLYAVLFRLYPDHMWNIEVMPVSEARAFKASNPEYELYVEGSKEYAKTVGRYWPQGQPWPRGALNHDPRGGESLPGETKTLTKR